MWSVVESTIKQYLEWWHGHPDNPSRQYQYYRCEGCRDLVTWNTIHRGGCLCGLSNRLHPARLRIRDKARLLLLPWSV